MVAYYIALSHYYWSQVNVFHFNTSHVSWWC